MMGYRIGRVADVDNCLQGDVLDSGRVQANLFDYNWDSHEYWALEI